ncbi:diguanylate cyclase, partial [Candidatus Woesearchaeota archaeon]|nr:diguanylate cyclase [Candidatus Woesearchaeota archaeon]
MGETEKTGMNDLERKLERMTEDKNAWERKAKLLERANASILYVNDHSSQTMRMIDGRHKEISPLEQTCRAIAHTITEEFSKTGPVECAVSLSVPTIEKDDQGNAKIAVSTYTVKPEDDASWADINAVHLRQGEAFHSEVLPFDHGNALIYLTKKLDACDLEVSEQIKFMNVVKPHFATALANGYGRSKSMHAAEQLTKKFVRGHLGKNYKLDDIGMLPCFFDKRSGVQLLNIVLRSMRNLKEPVSIGLFDVDNFHDYNGAFGHIQGDVALLHLGLTMFQNIHHTHPHNDATIQKLYQELFHPTGPGDQVKEIDYDKQSKICADWKNEVVENLIVKQPRDFLIRYGGGEE